MNKTVTRTFVVTILACLFFASCTVGLDPAWKTTTTLSLKIGSTSSESYAAGRAVCQGSGYLYIRTIGGPSGSSGPFYGPYGVASGSNFTTTDIPAGTYTGFLILVASKNLENQTANYNGETKTFTQLMKLSDADFTTMASSTDTSSTIDSLFDGYVSGTYLENLTIEDNKTNTVSATLIPLTSTASDLNVTTATALNVTSDGSTLQRRFFKIDGISAGLSSGQTYASLTGKISAVSDSTIGIVSLYDSSGGLIQSFDSTGSIAAGASKEYTFTYKQSDSYYLYVEYTSTNIKIALSGTKTAAAVTVSFTGGTNIKQSKLFYAIYDMDTSSTSTEYGSMSDILGFGIIALDANGTGSSVPIDTVTKANLSLTSGTTYYIQAFVDNGGNYTDVTESTLLSSIYGLTPHFGDYVTNSTISVTASASTTFALTESQMSLQTNFAYFVAQTAAGTGSGATIANACTLATAIAKANSNYSTYPSSSNQLYMTGSLTVASSVTVSSDVVLMSDSTSLSTLTLTSSNITVSGTGSLSMGYLNVNLASYSGSVSPFVVETNGVFGVFQAAITGNNTVSASAGGFLSINGGSAVLMYSSVTKCSATNGGAVSVAASSDLATMGTFAMQGSSITNCAAAQYGGAIYSTDNTFVSLMGTETFSGNTQSGSVSNDVYTQSASSIVYDPNGLIAAESVLHAGLGTVTSSGSGTGVSSLRYVSSSGSGDGSSSASPCSLSTAIANSAVTTVILTSDLTVSSTLTIDRSMVISSLGSYSIYPDSAITGSVFSVVSGGMLVLSEVSIGPATQPGTASGYSLISIGVDGQFALMTGAVLQNANINGSGGAIYCDSGTVVLSGGSILNCAAATGGGGVYVTGNGTNSTYGSVSLSDGAITGCSSGSANGGGVYIDNLGSFLLSGGSVYTNSGMYGGGLYVAAGGTLMLLSDTFSITTNVANITDGGGGVCIASGGVLSDTGSYASTQITGNTAISVTSNLKQF